MKSPKENVIKELQEYRKLGSIEELKSLKEKNTAKSPIYEGDGYYKRKIVFDTWYCPCCDASYKVGYDQYDYCPKCGQKVDLDDLMEL